MLLSWVSRRLHWQPTSMLLKHLTRTWFNNNDSESKYSLHYRSCLTIFPFAPKKIAGKDTNWGKHWSCSRQHCNMRNVKKDKWFWYALQHKYTIHKHWGNGNTPHKTLVHRNTVLNQMRLCTKICEWKAAQMEVHQCGVQTDTSASTTHPQ